MDVYVGSPHVDAVKPSLVSAPDENIVHLAVADRVHNQMEGRRCPLLARTRNIKKNQFTIHKYQVMERKVIDFHQSYQPWSSMVSHFILL